MKSLDYLIVYKLFVAKGIVIKYRKSKQGLKCYEVLFTGKILNLNKTFTS